MIDLTAAEQANVRAGLRYLRVQIGGWKPLARVLGISHKTAANVACGTKGVGAKMAFRLARLAAVSLDDLLAGKYPPAGVCPHCGKAAR